MKFYGKGGCGIGKAKIQGHYCKVCGERKANEKFSGKGHNAHICKACARRSPAEQAETMAITRLYHLAARSMSDDEKKWLKRRTHDERSAVKELACEIYSQRFPHAKRNAVKKKIHLVRVDFSVDTVLCREDWSEQPVRCRFTLDRKNGTITMDDFDESTDSPLLRTYDKETIENIFRWMVDSLEIHRWEKDYCGEAEPIETDFDLDALLGIDTVADNHYTCMRDEPSWSVLLAYSDGSTQSYSKQ